MSFVSLVRSWLRRTPGPRASRRGAKRPLPLAEQLERRELLATGLVAAFAFNEGSGSTAASSVGGPAGALSGAAWAAAGRYDKALSFNGTNSLVTVTDANALHLTTALTLEAWVKPTALTTGRTVLLKEAGTQEVYSLYASENAGRALGAVRIAGSYRTVQGASLLPLNTWSHLASTYDGATLRLYVNGTQVGSAPATGSVEVSSGALRIGGNAIWGEYFAGLIDEVRVYNRALTGTEIQVDMNTPISPAPAPSPVVANAGPDGAANEGSNFTLRGSASGGSGGYTYSWNFGDGSTGSGANVAHAYADNGTYSATLTATDSQGKTAQDTAVVTVNNVAPAGNAGGPYGGMAGAAINFAGSATDPGAADTAAGFTCAWNFGDGSTANGKVVSHAYGTPGTYTVTLTVTDKDGGTSTVTTTATASAAAPAPPPFPNNVNPPPLPAPTGPVIRISTVTQLQSAVANLRTGDTILIDAGTYNVTGTLYLPQGISNVAIRGATGKRDDVVIRGAGMGGSIAYGFWVGNVRGVTFADLTVRDFSQHGIILNAGAQSPLIHNVHMMDIGDQMVKANPDGAGGGVNNGVVEYSVFEYTSGWAPDYYMAGVDVHTGNNWLIQFNTFKNMRVQPGSGQPTTHPAVLLWNGSQGSTVEWNTFINNDRDIALGLYQAAQSNAAIPDHSGGRIEGNMIYRDASTHGDVAIGVTGPGTKVYHNTYYDVSGAYANGIEYRWAGTNVDIKNNLTNRAILARDGATATLAGNVTTAQGSWFANPAAGDLHLVATATSAINKGVNLTSPLADYDGQSRTSAGAPDVGADEFSGGGAADTTPPGVSVTGPAGGATVSGTVSVSANASDNVGVAGVQFWLDGAALGAEDTAALYSVSWDTTGVANGTHTLTARARDAAGNQTTSGSVTVTVSNPIRDTTPPTVTAVSPANGATGVSTTANVTVTFSEAVSAATVNGATVQLRDAASNLVAATVTYNAATRTATLDPTPALANSTTYTVVVRGGAQGVQDLAGNALATDYNSTFTTPAPAAAPVANAGPDTSATEGSSVPFSASVAGGQPALTYSWNFGDGGSASGTLTPSHTFADNGVYTVTFTVADALGRTSSDTLTVTVTNVAPTPNPGGPSSGTPGSAVAFTGAATDPSPTDTAAGFTYRWDFGDGSSSTQKAASHAYAQAGTYTVTLTAWDKDGGSRTGTTTVTVSAPAGRFSDPYIVTPYDRIPNFGANPTIYTVANGNWSDVTIWSGGRLPTAGDIVSIDPGFTVTYDVVSDAAVDTVEIQAGSHLVFRTDVTTRLTVNNLLVLPNGELRIGTAANPVAANVKAEVVIPDQAINTTKDPEQFGHGLVALGKVTVHGAVKDQTFVRLAAEPKVGQTTLTLSQAVTGWQVGDRLVLSDTRQLTDATRGANYVSQLETLTIAAISADGKQITLSAPLKFDHLGARNVAGQLVYLPHVVDLTRNVVIRSANAKGVRGQVLFTYRADVDVEYAQFSGLGRTQLGSVDNTTFDSSGRVTHVGTNEGDRNPVQFRHLIGAAAIPADGYQYTFVGNSIFCPLDPMTFVWGLNINDSSYGLIQDNVLYNWAGAGVVAKTGSESYNVIAHNMVVDTAGTSQREDDFAQGGSGFWMRGPNNYVRDNVAADINSSGWDIYNYGFNYYGRYVGTVNVPRFQGADPSVSGQAVAVNMNDTPILEFARNEVYGATTSGLSLWWIGTQDDTPYADARESVVQDFHVWHHAFAGIFAYPTNHVTIDRLVVLGDANNAANPYFGGRGVYFGDYMAHNMLIKNADIENLPTGIMAPLNVGRTPSANTTTIQDSFLANVVNIEVSPPRSVNGSGDLSPKTLVVSNVRFDHPTTALQSTWYDIYMDNITQDSSGISNFNLPDLVYVSSYNGVATDNFQVFYSQRPPANATTRARIGGKVL